MRFYGSDNLESYVKCFYLFSVATLYATFESNFIYYLEKMHTDKNRCEDTAHSHTKRVLLFC
jgi:hypothetical protein